MSHFEQQMERDELRHDVAEGFLFDAGLFGPCTFPGHDHITLDYGWIDLTPAYKKAAWAFKHQHRTYADLFDSQTDLTDTITEVYEDNLYPVKCPWCEAIFDND